MRRVGHGSVTLLAGLLGLAGCLLAHALLARLAPSPWWVPNLTLVGLIVGLAREPRHWVALSGAAGLFTMMWAVRFPQPILLGYLLIGGGVRTLAQHWDLSDARVQALLIGLASAAMTASSLWLDHLWSLALVGLAGIHVAVTLLAAPVARRVMTKCAHL